MNSLGKTSTGGNVYFGYDTATSFTYKPKSITLDVDNFTGYPEKELVYRGEKYRIDRIERSMNSIDTSGEITIHGYRTGGYLEGFSGTFTIDDPKFVKDFKRAFNPYAIKKVICNPAKNATTVIFEDGTVEVVKKSPDDPEADIFSVVAYAVAKRIYGSNSAFKREVLKNLDFIDKEMDNILVKVSTEDLAKAFQNVVNRLKASGKVFTKKEDTDEE